MTTEKEKNNIKVLYFAKHQHVVFLMLFKPFAQCKMTVLTIFIFSQILFSYILNLVEVYSAHTLIKKLVKTG